MQEIVTSNFSIRPCMVEDLGDIRRVCFAAALLPVSDTERVVFPLLYCDYYVKHETDNCFVLLYSGKVVGYILSSINKDYYKVMKKEYLPLVQDASKGAHDAFVFGYCAQRLICPKYKAHLHIDIEPAYQRYGQGTRLMDTLLAHLSAKGIKRVMLACSAHNEKGVAFYTKYGFRTLFKNIDSHLFGINIASS